MGFDPASLALASTIAEGVGGAVSAVGAISAGQAASKNAAYQSQIAQMNANIATQNARYAIEQGQQKEQAQQLKSRAQIGGMIAAQGANGLDVNSGSNLQTVEGAADLSRLDALTIRNDAAREAYNFQTQSVSDTAQAGLLKSQSSQDLTSGYIGAGSSLLSAASSVGNTYLKYSMYSSPNTTDTAGA